MRSNENRSPLHIDLLIFDMDGVLVDVSRSYRQAIQQTVQIYFETCLGLKKSRRSLITKEDISIFKSIGGFNNDWELTSALILYLLSISGISPSSERKRLSTIGNVVQSLKARSSSFHLRTDRLLRKKNLSSFIEKVKSSKKRLKRVRLVLRNTKRTS